MTHLQGLILKGSTMTKKVFLFIFLLVLGLGAFGQTALIQTTLAAQVSAGTQSAASGVSGPYTTQVALTSVTGVNPALNGQPVTYLYIDQEAMGVLGLAATGSNSWLVLRAQQGTKAAFHANGAMVLVGTGITVGANPVYFAGYGSGGLQPTDPPLGGVCNLSQTGQTPWVNVITGAQWQCTSVAGTPATNGVWTPSWNNPLAKQSPYTTAAVASVAGTTTPSGPFFHLTGTNIITAWGIPVGFNATTNGSGSFCFIADGASSTTATNNIGTAITFTANNIYCWFWDQQSQKFYVK